MRIAVTGHTGQIALAMAERGPPVGAEIILVGRPELDLVKLETIARALAAVRPHVIVNAAAYTAVDQAEGDAVTAYNVNEKGASYVATAARDLGVPLLHLSTDYVFDGALGRPYREDDATCPMSVYGASKRAGEQAVLAAGGAVAIFRTAWVYSPFGRNFVKTMVQLAATRSEVRVVSDQFGCPTSALDIADALIAASRRLTTNPDHLALRGIFHMAGAGDASWYELAQGVFDELAALGRPRCTAESIPSSSYPTPARRPDNSRLDTAKLKSAYAIALPGWRSSLPGIVARLAG